MIEKTIFFLLMCVATMLGVIAFFSILALFIDFCKMMLRGGFGA